MTFPATSRLRLVSAIILAAVVHLGNAWAGVAVAINDGTGVSWGDTVTGTITITNTDTIQSRTMGDLVVTLNLGESGQLSVQPALTVIQQTVGATTTTIGSGVGTVGTSGGDDTITWDLDALLDPDPTVELNDYITIEFSAVVLCDSVTHELDVAVDGTLNGAAFTTFTDLDSLTVKPPYLALTLTPLAKSVALKDGTQTTWTMTITNTGDGNANNLQAVFSMDADMSYVDGTATIGGTAQSGAVTTAATTGFDDAELALTAYTWDLGTNFSSDPDGAGDLDDLDGDGQYDDLPPGGSITISGITAEVGCEAVAFYVDARCGDSISTCVDTRDTGDSLKSSVSIQTAPPEINVTFSSLTGIDYCDGSTGETLTVQNPDNATNGPVTDLSIALAGFPTSGFDFTGLTAVIQDIGGGNSSALAGITFDAATGTFDGFPNIDRGREVIVTFNAVWATDATRICDGTTPYSVTVYESATYTDVCGSPYTTVPSPLTISRTTERQLRTSMGHSSNGFLNDGYYEFQVNQTGVTFTVTASIKDLFADAEDLFLHLGAGGTVTARMVLTYDEAFTFTALDGGTNDTVNNQIYWTHTFSSANTTFSKTVTGNVTANSIPTCEAGKEFTNYFSFDFTPGTMPERTTTMALTDCIGCDYTVGGTAPLHGYINQDPAGSPIDSMDKEVAYIGTQNFLEDGVSAPTSAGSYAEYWRPYEYTVTFDLSAAAPATWAGIVLLEKDGSIPQDFDRLVSVVYDGVNYGPGATNEYITTADDITQPDASTVQLDLADLDASGVFPNSGGILVVTWRFRSTTTPTTHAQFSEIQFPAVDPGCDGKIGYETGVPLYVDNQVMDIDTTMVTTLERCDISTHQISLTKGTAGSTNRLFHTYDLYLEVPLDPENDGAPNYTYIEDTTSFSGFVDVNGVTIDAFEPTVDTVNHKLIWDFRLPATTVGRVATMADLGGTWVAGTFTNVPAPSDTLTIDDVDLAVNDQVLVKDQTSAEENGVYVVQAIAGGVATLARATDYDSAGELPLGLIASVSEGTEGAAGVYKLASTVTTLNTDAVTWANLTQLADVGTIQYDLWMSCDEPVNYTAALSYNDYYGHVDGTPDTRDKSDSDPLYYNIVYDADLRGGVDPSSRTLLSQEDSYVLRLSNSGAGDAHNVTLTATFSDALAYVGGSAKILTSASDTVGSSLTPTTNTTAGTGGGALSWTFQLNAEPDGVGTGLADLDGDGFYDDLASGNTLYILVSVNYVSCTDPRSINLAAAAGCALASDGGTTPVWSIGQTGGVPDRTSTEPDLRCSTGSGSTGSLNLGSTAVSTIHVDPSLSKCETVPLTLRTRVNGAASIYDLSIVQTLPDATANGIVLTSDGATYSVDGNGDGDFTGGGAEGDVLNSPFASFPAKVDAGVYDTYTFTTAHIPEMAVLPRNGVVEITMTTWATCDSLDVSSVSYQSQASYTKFCGDAGTSAAANTTVTVRDVAVQVALQGKNLTAGDSSFTVAPNVIYGGVGDQLTYRAFLTNTGGVAAKNFMVELTLPTLFSTASGLGDYKIYDGNPEAGGTELVYATDAAPSLIAGQVLSWNKTKLLQGSLAGGLPTSGLMVVEFTATVNGADKCQKDAVVAAETFYGCADADGLADDTPIPADCYSPNSFSSAPLYTTTNPDLATPEMALSATDLSGSGTALTTGGIVTVAITGNAGPAADMVLTLDLPSGWTYDGEGTHDFSETDDTLPTGGLDGVTVGVSGTDPATLTATFTNSLGNALLRDGLTAYFRIKVVQNSSFDSTYDAGTAEETTANSLDPAAPADFSASASLAFDNTCGDVQTPATKDADLTVLTPDLDVEITAGTPSIVTGIGDTQSVTVALTNRGDAVANYITSYTAIGKGWDITSAPTGFDGDLDINGSEYAWVLTGTANVYRLTASDGSDPGLYEPTAVGSAAAQTAIGDVDTSGEWFWGDEDGLGYDTVYYYSSGAPAGTLDAAVAALTVPPSLAPAALSQTDNGGATPQPGVISGAKHFRIVRQTVSDISASGSTALDFELEVANKTEPLAFLAFAQGEVRESDGTTFVDYYSQDSHLATIIGFDLTKTLASTSEAGSSSSTVLIGEDVQTKLTAEWFGGGSQPVTGAAVTDNLPDGQGHVSYSATSGAGYVTPGSAPTDASVVGDITDFDGTTQAFTTFGSIDTSTAAQTAEILVWSRMLNTSDNANGDTSLDTVVGSSFTYLGNSFNSTSTGFPTTDLTETVTVSEPQVTIDTFRVVDLTVHPTPGAGDWVTSIADIPVGHSVRFELVSTATSGRAVPYDTIYTLNLDDAITFDSASDGGTEAAGVVTWPATNLTPGSTYTRTVDAVIGTAANPSETLTNTAKVDYDTLDGTSGSQQAPAGTNDTATGARIYTVNASNNIALTTEDVDVSGSAKITDSSETSTTTAANQLTANATIGEEVEITLQVVIPPGTIDDPVMSTVLPAGLTFVEANNATITDVDIQGGSTTGTAAYDSGTRTVTWTFADTTVNIGTGGGDDSVTLLATFIARVDNISANEATDTLSLTTNTFTHLVAGSNTTVDLNDLTLTVVEPAVTITTAISPDTGVDAGDELTVTVTVTNNSTTATAYNVVVTDDLTGDFLTKSGAYSDVTGTLASSGGSATIPTFTYASIPPDTTYTFTYPVTVDTAVTPPETLSDDATAVWTSLASTSTALNTGSASVVNGTITTSGTIGATGAADGMRDGSDGAGASNLNNYETTASDSATVSPLTMAKTKVTAGSTFTVGDQITYRVTINLPEGTIAALTLADTLDTGLVLDRTTTDVTYTLTGIASINAETDLSTDAKIEAAIDVSGAADEDAGTISWLFGTVVTTTEDDTGVGGTVSPQIVVDYTVRVANLNTVDFGDTLGNAALVSYTGGTNLNSAPADITVVEPRVTVTKTVANVTSGKLSTAAPDAGDTLRYTVTVANGTTNASAAYDFNIVDTLEVGLAFSQVVTATSDIDTAPTVVGTGATGSPQTLTWGRTQASPVDIDLAASTSIDLVYDVTVLTAVLDGQSLDNSVVLDWTSLDGDIANERTGADGEGVAPDDYKVTKSATKTADIVYALAKTIDTTTDSGTSSNDLTIGEEVTFTITATFGEGTTESATITDDLPTSPGVLQLLSASVVSIGGNTTASSSTGGNLSVTGLTVGDAATVSNEAGSDSYNDRAVFDFGTVVNSGTDDTVTAADQIVLQVEARLVNIAANEASETSTNNVSLKSDTTSLATASATVDTVEPDVVVTKVGRNVTAGDATDFSVFTAPDAGDEIEYRITLANADANNATAYDVDIVDTLPVGVLYKASSASATLDTIGAGTPAAFGSLEASPDGTPGGPLNWGLGTGNDLIDIPDGDAFILTYRVIVQDSVEPSQTLANSAVVTWTSLNGVDANERNASGTPPNDYTDSDSTTVDSADSADIAKARTTDTYGAGDANVRVGDVITYQLTVTLPEGTTDAVVVSDALPAGLEFVDTLSVDGDTSAPYAAAAPFTYTSVLAASTPTAGDTGTVEWVFNTVVNASNNSALDDSFTIVYRARVINDGSIAGISTDQDNTASLDYQLQDGSDATTETATVTVTVKQPLLTVAKSSSPADGSTDVAPSQVVTYTVTIANTGDAPAYDPVVRDTIPVGMRANGIDPTDGVRIVSMTLNGSAVTTPPEPVDAPDGTDFADNGVIEWNLDTGTANEYTISAGGSLVIVYRVNVDSDIGASVAMTNSASITHYYSFDDDAVPTGSVVADRLDYGSVGPDTVTLTSDSPGNLSKTAPSTAVVGETITYTIKVPADGNTATTTLYDVVVTDVLPGDATYISATTGTGNAGTGFAASETGGTATFTFDTIPPSSQAVITVTAKVDNVSANQAGTILTNTARYSYKPVDGGATDLSGGSDVTASTTVEEPVLTLTKAAANQTHPGVALTEAGDVIEYTLTLAASGAVNTSDAFDVSLVDTLGEYLEYDTSFTPTVTGTGNTITAPSVSGTGAVGDTQTLTWSLADGTADIDIPAGSSVTVTYRAKVLGTFANAYAITNDVTASWTSIDGGLAGNEDGSATSERTGSGPAVNDYSTSDDTSLHTTFELTKTCESSTNAAVGESVEYQLVLAVTQGLTEGVTITDTLPTDMSLVAESVVVTLASGLTTGYIDEDNSVSVSGTPDEVVFNFGDVNCTNPAPNNTITITYSVLVENEASNAEGATKTNSATASATGVPDSTDTADITIREPVLTAFKEFENITKCGIDTDRKLAAHRPEGTPSAKDTLRFTVTLTNTSTTATAYDVDLHDMVGATGGTWFNTASLADVSATLNGAAWGGTLAPEITGTELNWGLGNSGDDSIDIAPDSTFVLVYTVQVNVLADSQDLTRNVEVTWTSTDGVNTNERNGSGTGENDYSASYTHSLYAFDSSPTEYTVLAGASATLDANGNLDLDTADANPAFAIGGGERIILQDGSTLSVTGDGLPALIEGYVNITVAAGASATIQQTENFVVDKLDLGGNPLEAASTLTVVNVTRAGPTINYGSLTMGAGDTLIFPDDATVLIGPASIQGKSGYSNLATIRPTTENGGLTLIFSCDTDIDYAHFAGIAHGYVEFQGPTAMDHALFTEGDGTNPYVKYVHPASVVWSQLAFRSDDGATTTIENVQTDADTSYYVEVDGYLGPTDNYIGGNGTDIEPAATTNDDPNSGVRWSNATPAFGVVASCSAPETGGVEIRWSAQVELGVLKYQIQVADGNSWSTVGEVFARTEGLRGGSYAYLDRSAKVDAARTYRLLCVDVDGKSREHEVGKATAVAEAPAAVKRSTTAPAFPADGVFSVEELTYAVQHYATDTPTTLGTARKAEVAAGGLYSTVGVGQLYNVGQVLPDLGGFAYIRPYSDPYTDANVVWSSDEPLDVVGAPGVVPAPAAQGQIDANGYTAIIHVERDETLALNSMLPPGPNWFYAYSSRLSPDNAPIVTADVPSPASAGTAKVKVAVRSTTDGDHDLGVTVNGIAVARATWSGKGHHMVEVSFDLATCPLYPGANTIQLWTSVASSSKRLDYVEVWTPATPVLRDGSLVVDVLDGASEIAVDGSLYAVDITEFGSERLLGTSRGAVQGLQAGQKLYFATTTQSLDWSEPKDLTAVDTALQEKDYVAVAPEGWVDVLAPLVAKHQDEGLASVAVTIEDVNDTYGGGLPTPAALVRLGQRIQPKYLLIGAGASHDPKGLQGDLPPAGIATGFIHVYEGTASTDDLYSGNYSIAVGRLPARTRDELLNMVRKIVDFYPGRRAVMMADVDDATMSFGSFATLQAELAQQLPSVLLDANTMNGAEMRAALIDAINDGANLVTYQGHGNNALIGDDFDILNASQASSVPPSAWLLATCLTGVYTLEDDDTKVLASQLLRTPGNGAVSVFASTCYGQAGTEHQIVEAAVRKIAAGGATWGQILLDVKQTLLPAETAAIYTLLGDPAMYTLNPVEGDREIIIREPVAGGFINAQDVPVVRFGLRGGWWRQRLEVLWRRDYGEWSPLGEVTIDPEVFEYTVPWEPAPNDGDAYQIMIREITDDSEER